MRKALRVTPGRPGSAALEVLPEPTREHGDLLVQGIAVGICGTDHEIVAGAYGWAPPGSDRLVLGHESLGRVLDAPADSGFAPGDLVVGVVRRPDPEPCSACAVGEWDMCRNGRYREHGIKELDGFAAERYPLPATAAVPVPAALGANGVLLEPASVVAKAWDHINRIGARAAWAPERVLVTGAGPVGLLAALFAVHQGFDVHVLDLVAEGTKPELVRDLGATYHHQGVAEACKDVDVVVECTGHGGVVVDVVACTAPGGIVCLTGISSGSREILVETTELNRRLVLENDVVFGSVNANLDHYRAAVDVLVRARPDWLARICSRRVPLDDWVEAFRARADDVKVVLALDEPPEMR